MRQINGAKPGRLSIPAEIGLFVVCGAAAGLAAISALRCIGETGGGGLPGDKVSAACSSVSAGNWYLAGVGAAAAIALVGVLVGHARDSRRPALVGASISIALTAICVLLGFAIKAEVVP